MRDRLFFAILCVTGLGCGTALGEELKARGVNPAENDTRIDVILKNNWLPNKASIVSTTLKFDYRLTPEIGLNLEIPVFGHFRSASPAPGIAGLDDTGLGDIYWRFRYILPVGAGALGATSVGGALEAVFPTASAPTLGLGVYQLNVTGVLVQAWTPTLITAFVAKAAQSIDEIDGRTHLQENTARVVQAFILSQGRFVTLDVKYNWETVDRRHVWWDTQVEFGTMLDVRTSTSIALARKLGDRSDLGSVSLNFKRFF